AVSLRWSRGRVLRGAPRRGEEQNGGEQGVRTHGGPFVHGSALTARAVLSSHTGRASQASRYASIRSCSTRDPPHKSQGPLSVVPLDLLGQCRHLLGEFANLVTSQVAGEDVAKAPDETA